VAGARAVLCGWALPQRRGTERAGNQERGHLCLLTSLIRAYSAADFGDLFHGTFAPWACGVCLQCNRPRLAQFWSAGDREHKQGRDSLYGCLSAQGNCERLCQRRSGL